MRSRILLCLMLFCCPVLTGQQIRFEFDENSRIIEGRCRDVLAFLQSTLGNDSAVVRVFLGEYKIKQLPANERMSLQKETPQFVIRLFNSSGYMDLRCRLKNMRNPNPVLLMKK